MEDKHGSKLDNQAEIEGLKILEKNYQSEYVKEKTEYEALQAKMKDKERIKANYEKRKKNMKLKSRKEMKFKKNSTSRIYATILGKKKCGLNAKMRKIKQ